MGYAAKPKSYDVAISTSAVLLTTEVSDTTIKGERTISITNKLGQAETVYVLDANDSDVAIGELLAGDMWIDDRYAMEDLKVQASSGTPNILVSVA